MEMIIVHLVATDLVSPTSFPADKVTRVVHQTAARVMDKDVENVAVSNGGVHRFPETLHLDSQMGTFKKRIKKTLGATTGMFSHGLKQTEIQNERIVKGAFLLKRRLEISFMDPLHG
jgi:hypothetical protein